MQLGCYKAARLSDQAREFFGALTAFDDFWLNVRIRFLIDVVDPFQGHQNRKRTCAVETVRPVLLIVSDCKSALSQFSDDCSLTSNGK
jgi:hypothetical protein